MLDNLLSWWMWPLGFVIFGLMSIVFLVLVVFWVLMIVDCAKRKFKNSTEKIVWILVIVFLKWFGAVVYFLVIHMYNRKGISEK